MRSSDAGSGVAAPVTYRSLLRNREFVGILATRTISVVGDQIARVALTVLVFDRTSNAFFAALAFGATVVPGFLSPLVSGVADRWPRRRLLIGADLVRAALLALMAIPGVPWGALTALMALVTLVSGPQDAARTPLLRSVLGNRRAFLAGTALEEAVEQPGQIAGFLLAGLLLSLARPQVALLADAASFAISAVLLVTLIAARPSAAVSASGRARPMGGHPLDDLRVGLAAAFAPQRRRPLLLCWVAASAVFAPDVLIAPWARQLGVGGFGISVLLGVQALALFVVLPLVGRLPQRSARRGELGLIVLSLAPLALCVARPSLPLAVVLLGMSGAGSAFTVLTRVEFMKGLRDDVSGRAYSVASGGLCAGQGLCVVGAGFLADQVGASRSIGIVGVVGLVVVGAVLAWTESGTDVADDEVIRLPEPISLAHSGDERRASGGAYVIATSR